MPYGSIDLAMADKEVRGSFTIEQSLADFAEIILSVKENLSSHDSPVIVMGGSYGGSKLILWINM